MGPDDAHHQERRRTGVRHRSPLTWLVAAAAVVLIVAAVGYALTQRGATPTRAPAGPTPVAESSGTADEGAPLELTMPADTSARCMTPGPSVLRTADVAVDAEAVEVTDTVVTLDPSRFYRGRPADLVTVDQASVSMHDLIGAVRFELGGRYLVAADGGDVMVCGFSGPYEAALARLYAEAFAR